MLVLLHIFINLCLFIFFLEGEDLKLQNCSVQSAMTIKLYTFRLSPPARFAHLVAKIAAVQHEQIEVDLSRVSSWHQDRMLLCYTTGGAMVELVLQHQPQSPSARPR